MSQINLTIDSEDKLAVRASLAFFETLSGEPVIIKSPAGQVTLNEHQKEIIKQVEEKGTVIAEVLEDLGKGASPVTEEKEPISLNDLRQLVAKKAQKHKPEIREWLNGKGYSKTPELPQELYGEYVEFLNGLS